ncbi:MAG: hypothetical protein LAT61_09630 [Alcanivorax sp.]|nr:hypothetical protein [Alcanivorax sp.]
MKAQGKTYRSTRVLWGWVSWGWHLLPGTAALVLLAACDLGGNDDARADAVLLDRPVAYVARSLPRDENGMPEVRDLRDPAAFFPGATLYLRELASPNAREASLTTELFEGAIDVRDLSVSFDGRRLLFALRAPEIDGADDDEQPTWNIWEYDLDTALLRRVINNDLVAEEGQDLFPRYLPDGRIVFASTRQRQARARLLDEGKPQFAHLEETRQTHALSLHVMSGDGSNIRQISFNPGHDMAPLVLGDGRLAMLRWDNKQNRNSFDLYALNPDGTATGLLYGKDRQNPAPPALNQEYTDAQWLPDGALMVLARPRLSSSWSGIPRRIDIRDYQRRTQMLPGGAAAQEAEQLLLDMPLATSDDVISRGGRVAAMVPLSDGTQRYLAAWSPCRALLNEVLRPCTDDVLDQEGVEEAEPAYGLWIFDQLAGTERPVVLPRAGRMITAVAVMSPRQGAALLPDLQPGAGLDLGLYEDGAGVLDIRSVFDVDGNFETQFGTQSPLPGGVQTLSDYRDPALVTAEDRVVRFLRVSKAVLIPDDDLLDVPGTAFGRNAAFGMREIAGYIPVEPDGSVRAVVPANVPLEIQLVDAAGRALGNRHGSWLTVRPGETLRCNGCHAPGSGAPHGRYDALALPLNAGAPDTGVPFPNTRAELFADFGETMAQVRARLRPEDQSLQADMLYEDIWTDPAVREPDAPLMRRYDMLDTPLPVTSACLDEWDTLCRSLIQYEAHIQPLWEFPRETDEDGVITDVTCVSCHTRRDDMNQLQVAPAQLELTGEPSGQQPLHLTSYRELLFPDTALVLQDGALVEERVPLIENGEPVYQVDEEGELILDDEGEPIPVLVPVQLGQRATAGNARASNRFFSRFAEGGSHAGWLSAAELRLVAEWLDIGGQYYNNPFDVPQ